MTPQRFCVLRECPWPLGVIRVHAAALAAARTPAHRDMQAHLSNCSVPLFASRLRRSAGA